MLARKLDMDGDAQYNQYNMKDVLYAGAIALSRATIGTASLDARILLQHVLGISREELLADESRGLSFEQYSAYQALIEQRLERKPVAQLIGKREFFGRVFAVTGDTLDPRPDSETLIEAVLARCPDRQKSLRILDLGTGTGCLMLTLLAEYQNATGLGIDKSAAALHVAKRNAESLEVEARATLLQSHWIEKTEETFDIIISNPPYIPTADIAGLEPEVRSWEPKLALDGGADGLDCYREIVPQLPGLLAEKGFAVLEIGIGQEKDGREMVARCSLLVAGVYADLGGIPRCVIAKLTSN